MNSTASKQVNPLGSFMRQPKIYIRLPSRGEFWPEGSLDMTETGDFPVYSMTAKDEILLKIPDALMNGQAVVDVIQHCIPNIKNAWNTPSIDLDIILIAIRLATYGEQMTTPLSFGEDLEMDYSIDLRIVMDTLMNQIIWESAIPLLENLTVFVKPISYKQVTESALQAFETQKIMQIANDDKMSEDEKIRLFRESFKKLTDSTVGTIGASIFKIDTDQISTDNPMFIKEFVDNVDKEIFDKIQNHLEKLRDRNSIKPIKVQVTDEMKAKGVTGDTIEVPLTFDPSTFFV